jgi:hypothetical protein
LFVPDFAASCLAFALPRTRKNGFSFYWNQRTAKGVSFPFFSAKALTLLTKAQIACACVSPLLPINCSGTHTFLNRTDLSWLCLPAMACLTLLQLVLTPRAVLAPQDFAADHLVARISECGKPSASGRCPCHLVVLGLKFSWIWTHISV